MQVLDRIYLEIWKNNEVCVCAVQGEANARFLEIQLCNNGVPVRLSGQIVNLYMTKPDGTQIFNQCTIEGEENGLITVGLTAQMSSAAGFVKNMELWVSGTDGSLLKIRGMTMDILPSNYEEAIESSDEMTAFQNAMAAVNDIETIRSLAQGAIPSAQKGAALGVATLDADGKLKQVQLPETVASISQVCNPNQLDNWYMGEVVNQRGQTSYTTESSWKYTVDRWKIYNGTLEVEEGKIRFTADNIGEYKRITQMSEGRLKAGQTYTLSVLAKAETAAGAIWMRPCTKAYGAVPGVSTEVNISEGTGYEVVSKTFTPSEDVEGYGVEILCGDTLNDQLEIEIAAWKLELGGTQTLAHEENGEWMLNGTPNYTEQLLRCQRYQLPVSLNQGRVSVIAANALAFMIPTPVTMRANPAVTGAGLSVRNPQGAAVVTGFTFSAILAGGGNGIGVTASKTGHGLTDASLFAGDSSGFTILDANL